MATRLEEVKQVDKVLTGCAQGYTNDVFIGEYIFKKTLVDKETNKFQMYGKEQFIDYGSKIIRPIGVKPQEDNWEPPELGRYECEAYSLAGTVDQREISEAAPLNNLLIEGVDQKMEKIRTAKEKNRADVLSNYENYDNGHVLTPLQKWDNDTNVAIMLEFGKTAIRSKIGREPNIIVMGHKVWELAFKFNNALSAKIKYSERDVLTTELVAQILEVDKVLVGYSQYMDPDDKTLYPMWGNMLSLCYVTKQEGRNRPTFARTFQKKGYPNVKKWIDDADFHRYRVEDIFDNRITGKDAGYLYREPVEIPAA
ncbi:MAG: hypothetical protein GY739_21790 [Mesoflavibacter sp.]|nr:hypothetical protein [Mesoflavibacter sp.]